MDREDNKNIKNKYLLFLNIKMKTIKYNVNRLLLILSFVLVLFGSYIGSSFGSTKKQTGSDVAALIMGADQFKYNCAACHSLPSGGFPVTKERDCCGPNLDVTRPSSSTIKAFVRSGAIGSPNTPWAGGLMASNNGMTDEQLDSLSFFIITMYSSVAPKSSTSTTPVLTTPTVTAPTTTTQRITASPTGTTSPNQKATVTDINAEDTTVLDVIASPRYDVNKKLNRIDLDVSAHADYANTKVAVQVYGRATSVTSPRWITLGRVILDESASALLKVRTSLNLKVCKDGAKIRLVDVDSLDIVSSGEIDYVSQNS